MDFELPFLYKRNVLLKDFSSFGIGGPATFFTEVTNVDEMHKVIRFCYEKGLRYFILGKGSNCLFDDRGFEGLIIYNRIDYVSQQQNIFKVGAGFSFTRLGSQTARLGFSGLEFASGIPASVGGAIYMNAGANECETCQTLDNVLFINEKGDVEQIQKDQIDFAYRFSSFQNKKGAIIEASFKLTDSKQAKEKQKNIIEYRLKTQPYGEKSAGCVFRNLPCSSAGALIDRTGLKGFEVGGAKVSELHANFIVNKGQAKSNDVLELIQLIKEKIFQVHGLYLEEEIRLIPLKDV